MVIEIKMKLSIVIPVLDSHEILRRQLLHFEKMGLPDDTEIIIVDDGSDPALEPNCNGLPVRLFRTHDKRAWTWPLARNRGAKEAKGEYLLMFDIDHTITRDAIDTIYSFGGDKVQFKREFGVLLEDGTLTQDLDTLVQYGFPRERVKKRALAIPPLPNNFAMRRELFWDMGGYREDRIGRPYPQGEDRLFKKQWLIWERTKGVKVHTYRPTAYMFPNGYLCNGDVDYNPFNLFHKLSRANKHNYRYKKNGKSN
jgi:glycosyltransferase involved in cell wall biosynthesis